MQQTGHVYVRDIGAGSVTITPSGATINGATVTLAPSVGYGDEDALADEALADVRLREDRVQRPVELHHHRARRAARRRDARERRHFVARQRFGNGRKPR